MRAKALGINVRVSATEKEKLQANARLCGLSLSDYLRRLGLGKELEAVKSKKDYLIFRQIEALKNEISLLPEEEIIGRLKQIQAEL